MCAAARCGTVSWVVAGVWVVLAGGRRGNGRMVCDVCVLHSGRTVMGQQHLQWQPCLLAVDSVVSRAFHAAASVWSWSHP